MTFQFHKKKKLVFGRALVEKPWVDALTGQLQDLDYAAALKKGY